MTLTKVSPEEIQKAEERAQRIREQKKQREENFVFEQTIEKVVKEICRPAIDIIKGSTDFEILSENIHPQRAEINKIGFTKNGKKYVLQLNAGTTYNDKNVIGRTQRKDGSIMLDYEQLIVLGTEAMLIDVDTNSSIWNSRDWKTFQKFPNLIYPELNKQDLFENINAASAVYVMDALRTQMEKSKLKSKLLLATENLRIAGYRRTPFYGPEYSDAR